MADEHPARDELIDFAEGETSPERSGQIEAHLEFCKSCRSYVASVEKTLSFLGIDRVPEPSPGYWAYFEQRVRERVRQRSRRLIFALAPGLAAATAFLVLLWWLPQARVPHIQSMEIIMAEMTTGEIVDVISDSPYVGLVLLGAAEEDIRQVETYLTETEDVYDLVDRLSGAEKESFIKSLREYMQENESKRIEGTQYLIPTDRIRCCAPLVPLGKGC